MHIVKCKNCSKKPKVFRKLGKNNFIMCTTCLNKIRKSKYYEEIIDRFDAEIYRENSFKGLLEIKY